MGADTKHVHDIPDLTHRITDSNGKISSSHDDEAKKEEDLEDTADVTYKMEIVWENIAKFVFLHALALNGLILLPFMKWQTFVFTLVGYYVGAMGITAGAHRLWAHRSYKARYPLKLFLAFADAMAAQNSIYVWVRDHRAHHKFSETNGDPHNSTRGFFFAHMGWLLVRKHPEVIKNGSKIDLSDLTSDPLVMWQHRNFTLLSVIVCFVLPTVIPWLSWGESFWTAYVIAVFRYLSSLHATWLVNSAAHLWGDKPYDVRIAPSENKFVSLLALGEGFHNYHHTFPQDYSTSEWRWSLNGTTSFIDLMCFLGLAYDRKTVSKEMLERRIQRTGPGSNLVQKPSNEEKEF